MPQVKPARIVSAFLLFLAVAAPAMLGAERAEAASSESQIVQEVALEYTFQATSQAECETYLDKEVPGKASSTVRKRLESQGYSNVVCKQVTSPNTGQASWRIFGQKPAQDPTFGNETSWFYWLLAKLFGFIAAIFKFILEIGFSGVNWAMDKAFDTPTQLKGVWTALRDFINVVFALLTVGVAVMHILGIKTDTYAIKKALPRLIAAIILVNLSWIIGLLFLDLGNLVYHAVWNINPTTGTTPEIGALLDISKLESVAYLDSSVGAFSTTFNVAMWSAVGMVIYFLAVTPCIQLFLVLLVRILVLWLLLAVAPLAWLGFVVPEAAAETWGKYWKALVTMVFLPAKVALYFVIGILVINFYVQLEPGQRLMNTLTQDKTAGLSQYQLAVQAQVDETARQNGGQAKSLDVMDAIIVLLIGVFMIRLAAKDAMKTEWTEGAVALGGKLGGLLQKGSLRLAGAAVRLPYRGVKAATKQALKARQRTRFKTTGQDSAAKAAESLRSAQGFERKASGVEAAITKKRDMGTLTRKQEQNLTAKLREHRAKAGEMREAATAHQEDQNYYRQLSRGKLGAEGQAKGQLNFIDAQIKLNLEALSRGEAKDAQGRSRADNLSRLRTRQAQLNSFLAEHEKTGLGKGGRVADAFKEVTKGAVKDVVQPSAIPLAAKKLYSQIMGNINFNREMDATRIAQRVGRFLDLGDHLGGVLEGAGIDGSLSRVFQSEMDRKYAELAAKKHEDLLKYGDTGGLLAELRANTKPGDRAAMVSNELLFNKLLEKSAFMSKGQVSELQDWMKEVLAAEQKGATEQRLTREEFTQGFKDFGGILRRDNPFFTNVRLSEHGLHGFGAYDLRKVTVKHLKDANFPDFIAEMTKLRKDNPEQVKGEIPAGIADVAYNLFAPARSDLSDGALKNLQAYVKSRFASEPNLQSEFQQIKRDIESVAGQMKAPGADLPGLQKEYRKLNIRLRNLWQAFEQMRA